MYSYGLPHMARQKQDNQLKHTFSSYVRIWDAALKTCLRQWMMGRSGERGSGIFVLAARHDDNQLNITNGSKHFCMVLGMVRYLGIIWYCGTWEVGKSIEWSVGELKDLLSLDPLCWLPNEEAAFVKNTTTIIIIIIKKLFLEYIWILSIRAAKSLTMWRLVKYIINKWL